MIQSDGWKVAGGGLVCYNEIIQFPNGGPGAPVAGCQKYFRKCRHYNHCMWGNLYSRIRQARMVRRSEGGPCPSALMTLLTYGSSIQKDNSNVKMGDICSIMGGIFVMHRVNIESFCLLC